MVMPEMGFIFQKPLKDLKVICIPTAANIYSEENKAWLYEEMQSFPDLGIKLTQFDIEGKTLEDVQTAIQDADVVYVTGGNTYYLLEHMQKCNFKTAIIPFLEKGGIYIGSSAGMVAACPHIDFIADMDDPTQAQLEDFAGLGLVEFNIMPHTDHPKYGPKALEIMTNYKSGNLPIIGLRDNQAVLIVDNSIEIF